MAASLWSPVFVIGTLHIGNVEGASCVNFGNNYPTDFISNKKHNQGFGTVLGDGNSFRDGRNVVHDPDMIDQLGGGASLPEWARTMMEGAGREEPAPDRDHHVILGKTKNDPHDRRR